MAMTSLLSFAGAHRSGGAASVTTRIDFLFPAAALAARLGDPARGQENARSARDIRRLLAVLPVAAPPARLPDAALRGHDVRDHPGGDRRCDGPPGLAVRRADRGLCAGLDRP